MGMTYGSLVGPKTLDESIRGWLNYSRIPAEAILTDAQAMIYSMLRVREMRFSAVVTLAVGDSSAALPSLFLDPVEVLAKDGMCDIELVSDVEVERRRVYDDTSTVQSGPVTCVSADSSTITFDAASDTARKFSIVYYGMPAPLSATNQRNFLTDRYPHILRAMCAALAADFRHDDANYTRFFQRAGALIAGAQVEGDLSMRGQLSPRGFGRGR